MNFTLTTAGFPTLQKVAIMFKCVSLIVISLLIPISEVFSDHHDTTATDQNGLQIQLTEKGLQAVSQSVGDTSQKLIEHLDIDDYSEEGDKAENVQCIGAIIIVSSTIIFRKRYGIEFGLAVKNFTAFSTMVKAGLATDYKKVMSKIKEINANIVVRFQAFKSAGFHVPIIEIPSCTANVSKVEVVPPTPRDDKTPGDLKAKLQILAEKTFKHRLPDSLCKHAQLVASTVNSAFLSFGHNISAAWDAKIKAGGALGGIGHQGMRIGIGGLNISGSKIRPPVHNKINLTLFCGPGHHGSEPSLSPAGFRSYLALQLKNVTDEIPGLNFKTVQKQDATYGDKDVKMDMDASFTIDDDDEPMVKGGFDVSNLKSFNLPTLHPLNFPTLHPLNIPSVKPIHIPTMTPIGKPTGQPQPDHSNHDIGFTIRDNVVKSFLQKANQKNFFNTTLNVTQADIPEPVWTLVRGVFKDQFQMELRLGAEQTPSFHFTPSGAQVAAKLSTHLAVRTGLRQTSTEIVDASADMDISVKMFIQDHSVKASIAMGPSPQIRMHKVFLAGMPDALATDLVNRVLKSVVWPHIERKYNKLLGAGVRIPTPCGMSFLDPRIVNQDGAVKVCFDLKYDDSAFVQRVKQHVIAAKKTPAA